MALRNSAPIIQPRANRLTSAAATPVVSAYDLRVHLRLTEGQLSDADADDLIAEATQSIEDRFSVAMISQSWQLNLDRWPSASDVWWDGARDGHISIIHGGDGSVDIPRWPLQSLTSATTYAENSAATVITIATTFDVDAQSIPGRVSLKRGATWPTAMRANNAIEMVYVAGYGDAAVDVPLPMIRAVKQLAGHLYAHRGDGCDVSEAIKASGAGGIMGQYRVKRI